MKILERGKKNITPGEATVAKRRQSRIAAGISLASFAAGGRLLSRNEDSKVGFGLTVVGAIAGVAFANLDDEVRKQEQRKKEKEEHETRMEYRRAVTSFKNRVEDLIWWDGREHLQHTGKAGVYGSGQELDVVNARGQELTLETVKGSSTLSDHTVLTVWHEPKLPEDANRNRNGTAYVVYTGGVHSLDPEARKILIGHPEVTESAERSTPLNTSGLLYTHSLLEGARIVPRAGQLV